MNYIPYENGEKIVIDIPFDNGIKYFTFMYDDLKGIEPYTKNWDGTIENLYNNSALGCKQEVTNERAYCTKIIQMNGWKIPKDYPLRF